MIQTDDFDIVQTQTVGSEALDIVGVTQIGNVGDIGVADIQLIDFVQVSDGVDVFDAGARTIEVLQVGQLVQRRQRVNEVVASDVDVCYLGELSQLVVQCRHFASQCAFPQAVVNDDYRVAVDVHQRVQFDSVHDVLILAKEGSPRRRHAVPPCAQFFCFVEFGGVNTGNLEVFFRQVDVDFHVTFQCVVNGVARHVVSVNGSHHGHLEVCLAFLVGLRLDVVYLEVELHILEEEVYVLQIGLYILVDISAAVVIQVVLNLYLVILEDFGIALAEDDVFFLRGVLRISDKRECLLQILYHYAYLL